MAETSASEGDLRDGLSAGRESAFAELYDRLGPGLYRTALAITGSREEAEDAVQELFASLVRSRRSLAAVSNLKGYVFAALRRTAARMAAESSSRRRRHEEAAAEGAPKSPADPRLHGEEGLERALAALPAEQREVISLRIDGGLTFAEIGDVLGVALSTAASRYRYALEKLRSAVGEG
ncbi:MAG: RNA polymerase sigma factor [Planctomycetota bacterium]|jgi:RNA polymerase sigma-70 factor (ECF subfamily)